MKKDRKKKTQNQKIKNKLEKITKKENGNKEIRKLKKKKHIDFKKINKKDNKALETLGTLTKKRRIKWEMIIAILILFILAIRIGYIQLIKGEELQSMAYAQQTLDRSINPERRNGRKVQHIY